MTQILVSLDEFQEYLPKTEREITALYDEEGIYVYQAYNPQIARFAVEHQYFGGSFKLGRMTWIKPNFCG